MGIPAYFAHIIKNHKEILQHINKSQSIDYFMLDSNSIIYDQVALIDKSSNFESHLIKAVCEKIDYYISIVNPKKLTYITFDGVAPVAKLEQQRTRRYKSCFEEKILNKTKSWNTANITPGTKFMKKLTLDIKLYFKNNKNVMVSGSDDIGEGEHKIFGYMRENKDNFIKATTFIYGLDSDLIMLCLAHLNYCKNIYLFRETPAFIKSINKNLDPNKLYKLDIPLFSKILCNNFGVNNPIEYVFLFFLLGNDFIPHSPSINIRTNGIDILKNIYLNTIVKNNSTLISNNKINWKNFKLIVNELSIIEKKNIQQETELKINAKKRQIKNKEDAYNLIPSFSYENEVYINPNEKGWENRYYIKLFDVYYEDKRNIKQICTNYLEALEWTFKYYTEGCYDWRWSYNYFYTPLFSDLKEHIPYFDTDFIQKKINSPVNPTVQLSYVLPKNYLHLLPKNVEEHLLLNKEEWYNDNCEFVWSFCKYFWECHIKLPHIDIPSLEQEVLKA